MTQLDRFLPGSDAGDIEADGAMSVLLKQAFMPNLVQSLENNPVFIHGGPFANIAHGCNSVRATRAAVDAHWNGVLDVVSGYMGGSVKNPRLISG